MPDKDQDRKPIYTRREFLRTAALATGAVLAAPLLANPAGAAASSLPEKAVAKSSQAGSPIKLGVLLPESHLYPALGASFLAGMQAYLGQHSDSRKVTVIAERTGVGSQQMLQKAEKLLRADGANLLIGLLTPSVATRLNSLLEANRTLLVTAGAGENVPRQNEQNPAIFHHTLAGWQSNYALGEWAAGKLGRRAFIATSLYDSGYDALYAFRLGFERGGGAVAQTHVTGLSGDAAGMDALVKAMVQARPDLVYAAFCGQSAIDFVAAYARSGLAGRIPLAGSAFLVDESLIPAQGASALGVKTAFSSPGLAPDSPENQAFLASYRNQDPDAFALLGYETAQLVTEALNATGEGALQIETLKAALSVARFTGPHGLVAMDPNTQSTAGRPLYLREVQRQGNAVRNVGVARLDSVPEKDARVEVLRNSPKTGWLNTYLSV